jgi:hypothetical protein
MFDAAIRVTTNGVADHRRNLIRLKTALHPRDPFVY